MHYFDHLPEGAFGDLLDAPFSRLTATPFVNHAELAEAVQLYIRNRPIIHFHHGMYDIYRLPGNSAVNQMVVSATLDGTAQVVSTEIHQSLQGNGYGWRLHQSALADLCDRGICTVISMIQNPDALRLYEGLEGAELSFFYPEDPLRQLDIKTQAAAAILHDGQARIGLMAILDYVDTDSWERPVVP